MLRTLSLTQSRDKELDISTVAPSDLKIIIIMPLTLWPGLPPPRWNNNFAGMMSPGQDDMSAHWALHQGSSWHYYCMVTKSHKSPGPWALYWSHQPQPPELNSELQNFQPSPFSVRRHHNWNNLIIRISTNLYPGTDSNDETFQASDWLPLRHPGLWLADPDHNPRPSSGSLRVFLIMFDRCDELLGRGYYPARGLSSYLVTTPHSPQNTQLSAEKLMNTGPGFSRPRSPE